MRFPGLPNLGFLLPSSDENHTPVPIDHLYIPDLHRTVLHFLKGGTHQRQGSSTELHTSPGHHSREIAEEGEEGKGVINGHYTVSEKISLVFPTSQNLKERYFVCFTMEIFGSSGFSLLSLKTLKICQRTF